MIFVPIPFVVALLLFIVLVRLLRQEDWSMPGKRLFLLLIGAYAVQSVLLGLRWGYDMLAIMPFQAVLAALIAPLAWLAFWDLTRSDPLPLRRQWPHLLPAALVTLLFILWREPVGLVMIVLFLGYGSAMLWLARNGSDGLTASRLDGALLSYRSLLITAGAVIASAVGDIFISLDLDRTGGAYSGAIVAGGNVVALLILGAAASIASSGQAGEDTGETTPTLVAPTEEDGAVAASIASLMESREVYRDPELNLNRIARKLGMPARRVSVAVNRIHGISVSQYVNEFRIRAACSQLTASDLPVTRVMFDSGFISKSNFNREFLRVTGINPTEYRARYPASSAEPDTRKPVFMSR